MRIKRGDTVQFTSGDVPAQGKVLDIQTVGVFVDADRLVPIRLGKEGHPASMLIEGKRLWLHPPGGVVRDRDDCIMAWDTELKQEQSV